MFRKLKTNSAFNRYIEEKLFERAYEEFEQGDIRKGLWAKALSETEDNQKAAKSKYLALRVQSLKDDEYLMEEIAISVKKNSSENKKKRINQNISSRDESDIAAEQKIERNKDLVNVDWAGVTLSISVILFMIVMYSVSV